MSAAGPLTGLAPYSAGRRRFALARRLPVIRGDVLALSVPTWAPALAVGLDTITAWRASRPRAGCTSLFTPTAQTAKGAPGFRQVRRRRSRRGGLGNTRCTVAALDVAGAGLPFVLGNFGILVLGVSWPDLTPALRTFSLAPARSGSPASGSERPTRT